MPPGREEPVVILRGSGSSSILRVKVFEEVSERLSVTFTVKLEVPLLEGVPLILPESESSDNPRGRFPETRDQLKGRVPPCADKVVE